MSTDPKHWRPGDIVTVGQPGTATAEVELWGRAPVAMAMRGYCDPWWARHEGRWLLVERQRKGKYSVDHVRATDVHDRVLSGLATMNRFPAAGDAAPAAPWVTGEEYRVGHGRFGAQTIRKSLARLTA